MKHPWEEISLSDYENHMSLRSVNQLQTLNAMMKSQLQDYPAETAVILGVAGGNGLEHVSPEKYRKVYGIDINGDYLKAAAERYAYLGEVLELRKIDVVTEADKLPAADLLIADLIIEYIGESAFAEAVRRILPEYVSIIIQVNEKDTEWVSDSPYIHAFDGLDPIHHKLDEMWVSAAMTGLGYKKGRRCSESLPNGKAIVRMDFVLGSV